MKKRLITLSFAAVAALSLVGCSTTTNFVSTNTTSNNTRSLTTNAIASSQATINPDPGVPISQWQVVSRNHNTDGTVVSVDKTSRTLISLTLKVTKNIHPSTDPIETPGAPFHIGSLVKVWFYQPITSDIIVPKVGDQIELSINNYVTKKNNRAFWGAQLTPGHSNVLHEQTIMVDKSLSNLTDSYFQANATVDKFLYDWLSLDSKDGIALLNSTARQGKPAAQLEHYFTQVPPGHSSYEVIGYKKVSDTEYQFNVWMYGYAPGTYGPKGQPRPSPKTLTVVKQNNKWYINNLPKF